MERVYTRTSEILLLNPRNRAVLQGDTRRIYGLNARYKSYIILFFVVWLGAWGGATAMFSASAVRAYWRTEQNQQLNAEGAMTRATLIDRRSVSGEDLTTYYVTYRYEVKDETYTAEDEVPHSIYAAEPREKTILVRYLPDDPDVSRYVYSEQATLPATHHEQFNSATGIMGAISIGSLLIVILGGSNQILRAAKFRRAGHLAYGRVVEVKHNIGDPDNMIKRAQICYQVDGHEKIGHYEVPERSPGLNALTAGTRLAIWVVDERWHQPL